MKKLFLLFIIFMMPICFGETIVQTLTIGSQLADYSESLYINKFDSSQGTLTSITFSIQGSIVGTFGYENLSTSQGTGSVTAVGSLSLVKGTDKDYGTLLVNNLSIEKTNITLGAFDQVEDFAGTSGVLYNDESTSGTANRTISSGLSEFVGTGTMLLTFYAEVDVESDISGSNNTKTLLSAEANAIIITYSYSPAEPTYNQVPEPGVIALFVMGLASICFLKK